MHWKGEWCSWISNGHTKRSIDPFPLKIHQLLQEDESSNISNISSWKPFTSSHAAYVLLFEKAPGLCTTKAQLFISVEVTSDNTLPLNSLSSSLCSGWSKPFIPGLLQERKMSLSLYDFAFYSGFVYIYIYISFFFLLFSTACMALFKSRLGKTSLGFASFVSCSLDIVWFHTRNRFHLLTVTVPSQSMLATSLSILVNDCPFQNHF